MTQQESLPIFDFSDAVGSYAQGEAGARGAIFTRREVVEFSLDLAGKQTAYLPLGKSASRKRLTAPVQYDCEPRPTL